MSEMVETRPIPFLTVEQRIRFDEKITKGEDSCWFWASRPISKRPGVFKINKYPFRPHRIMANECFGPSAIVGKLVIRECGKLNCINPDHLKIGDHLDLTKIQIENGVHYYASRKYLGIKYNQGEKNPRSKISIDMAEKIFFDSGSLRYLSNKYGVSPSSIWAIRSSNHWTVNFTSTSAALGEGK